MFNSYFVSLLVCLITNINQAHGAAGLTDMKIVEEPSSFGLNNAFNQANTQQEDTLKLRVKPANFSGPPHFRRLVGRCFTTVINEYKYKFCPFSNVTQHEQGVHWNPYKGVLGVWQEWEVSNNTFVAMVMRDGDSCGRIFRSVKVTFMCGNHSQVVNVSEPQTCSYLLVFMTPLVCHPDSMLVYPTLTLEQQSQWDLLEGQMVRGELTPKGYEKRLAKILEAAGIFLSSEAHGQLVKSVEMSSRKSQEFESLDKCSEMVSKLREQIKNLTAQLAATDDIEHAFNRDLPDNKQTFGHWD